MARYGAATTSLGLASKPLRLGPDYAAPAPDGSWWVIDAAKKRLVHLSKTGTFRSAVVPASMLGAGGFPYQQPRVLANGTVVAVQQTEGPSDLLVVAANRPTVVHTSESFIIGPDDGKLLYGTTLAGAPVSVNPTTGAVTAVPFFRTQAGTRYLVTVAKNSITVALPDASAAKRLVLPLTIRGSVGSANPGVEVVSGSDGALHLLITLVGTSAGGGLVPAATAVGYATVTRQGVATAAEPMRDPTSSVDPGSPAHLTIAAGSSRPSLVFVDPDGLSVYLRSN